MLDIIILFFTSFQFCDHLCHSANQSGPDAESHQVTSPNLTQALGNLGPRGDN